MRMILRKTPLKVYSNLKEEKSLNSRIEISDVNFIIALVKADYVINYAEVFNEFTSLN